MKFSIDRKYILAVAMISLLLNVLLYVRILVSQKQTAYLVFDQGKGKIMLGTLWKNGNFIEWKQIHETDQKDTLQNIAMAKKPVKIVLSGDKRFFLMFQGNLWDNFLQFFCSLFFIFFLFLINYPVARPRNKFAKKKMRTIVFSVVITLASAYVLSKCINIFLLKMVPEPSFIIRIFYSPANFFFSLVILGASYYARSNYLKDNLALENEKLKRESLQTQFESLKNQVSPHFLFNSLNALQSLIREKPKVAQQYVNNLSAVLRYTLQSTEQKTVSLEDEMRFIQSYIFLLKLRHEPNLMIETNIPKEYMEYRLPPLTIQTLIENAVKHNEISRRNPLTITISTGPDQTLKVTNNLQKKRTPEPGAGIGLSNLMRRYLFLTGKEIVIKSDENEFTVEVLLINP